jgi:DnaK suppressor protein
VAAKSPTSRKKTAGKKSAPKKAAAAKPKPKARAAAAAKPVAKAAGPAAKPAPSPAKAARPAARPAAPKAVPAKPTPAKAVPSEARPVAARRKEAPVAVPPPREKAVHEAPAAEPAPGPRPPRGPREPSAHPDSGLSKVQVKKLHTRLLEERTAVLQEIRRSVQGAVEEVPAFTESIDQAQHETEQNFRLRLADKQRKLLNEIQTALLKLEEGEYGICEGTEDPIGYARLEVRPWARYSVEYKEMKDRRER